DTPAPGPAPLNPARTLRARPGTASPGSPPVYSRGPFAVILCTGPLLVDVSARRQKMGPNVARRPASGGFMSGSSSDRNPVERLAEEFAARLRNGERPSLTEYIERYPQHADDIRDLFPPLAAMEQLKPAPAERTGPYAASAEQPLERLGDYRILREVGRGGMGVVYEAEQLSLGRRVALKVLPAHALAGPQRLERFRREARAAAKLHH